MINGINVKRLSVVAPCDMCGGSARWLEVCCVMLTLACGPVKCSSDVPEGNGFIFGKEY